MDKINGIWLRSYPNDVKPFTEIKEKSMIEVLQEAIKANGNHTALVFGNDHLTYKQLGEKINKLANGLTKMGVKKGTRVALMMNNSTDLVLGYFATLFCGGIVVQNNPMYTRRELYYQINDSQAEILLIEERLIKEFPDILDSTTVNDIVVTRTENYIGDHKTIEQLLAENDDSFTPVNLNPKEDVAVLQYTGGTTGVSKGAMLTHFNLFANVVQTHEYLGVFSKEGREKILNVLPLFHVYGMTVSMNYSIYLKSTLFLLERFSSKSVLDIIHNENITMFPGTPTIYVAVNHDPNIKNYNLSSIHTCISGSAPLPVEVKNKFESLTGAAIIDAYGLSEASPVTHSNPVNGKRIPGSMGMPITNTDCKIVDMEDGETEMPINTPGELIIKGPQIMKGYWNRPEETEIALKDGWLYTGDIAYMNEEGYFFIVSRKKDVIIAGGYNIYPRDVEEVIFMHPAVQEVVVLGVPDEYRGETVKAYIIRNEEYQTTTEEEIIEFCRGRLARYKVPAHVEFRVDLPKSTVGKILRRKLLEQELGESNITN